MTTKREQCFECILRSAGTERRAYVGAWTPDAAEAEFREALARGRILQPGTIWVRDSRGRVLLEAEYQPPVHATVCEAMDEC